MDKLTALTNKKYAKLEEMKEIVDQAIAENRSKDESETKRYNTLDSQVKGIEDQIKELENQEQLNQRMAKPEVKDVKVDVPVSVQFRDWLKDSVRQGITSSFNGLAEYRADPWITGTDSAIINKTIAPGVDILTSPAEAFLRKLGVTFYTGLNGSFIVPSMGEDTATFASESGDASSANMSTSSLTLAARRVTHTQNISKETLAQTNPGIYASIIQNLVNGIYNAVTNDVFDTLQTDAASSVTTPTVAALAYGDLVKMEASIGGLNIGAGAYVTTPTGKAYLKQKIALGTTVGPAIWNNNEINGYPAYGVPAANANGVYFGDFSKMAVGQWGGLEIIVDPYTKAKQGEIVLTAIGMFDTGCFNKRGLCWTANASIGL
jgi:HK97 family phage major capsid protein